MLFGELTDWMFHCHDLHHASAGMVTVATIKPGKGSHGVVTSAPSKYVYNQYV